MLDDQLARCKPVFAIKRMNQLVEKTRFLKIFEKVIVFLEENGGIRVQDIDLAQIVALADFEVIEIMRRRDLDRTGTRFRIGIVIRNDRNMTPDQRQDHIISDQSMIARVVRIDRNTRIAQHGFRTRRRDHDKGMRVFRVERHVLERIAEMP